MRGFEVFYPNSAEVVEFREPKAAKPYRTSSLVVDGRVVVLKASAPRYEDANAALTTSRAEPKSAPE